MPDRMRVLDFLAARGDLEAEDRFFTQLRLRNGVFKMTRRHRFDDTFAVTIDLVERNAGRVLDVACSSGISTVELAEAIARRGLAREVHGTDAVIHARYLERADFGVLVDSHRDVLQIDHPRWAIPRRPNRRDLSLTPWRAVHALAIRAYVLGGATRATPIDLVSSLVAASGVKLHEEDLRKPQLDGTFGFVRIANVLNRSYFAEPDLRELVNAVVGRVVDGGFILVVRTHDDESNHGTYFERRGSRLIEVARIGGGSEVNELVRTAVLAR